MPSGPQANSSSGGLRRGQHLLPPPDSLPLAEAAKLPVQKEQKPSEQVATETALVSLENNEVITQNVEEPIDNPVEEVELVKAASKKALSKNPKKANNIKASELKGEENERILEEEIGKENVGSVRTDEETSNVKEKPEPTRRGARRGHPVEVASSAPVSGDNGGDRVGADVQPEKDLDNVEVSKSDDESSKKKETVPPKRGARRAVQKNDAGNLESDGPHNVQSVGELSPVGPGKRTEQLLKNESDGPRNVQPSSASSATSNSVSELSPVGPGKRTEQLLKNLNVKIEQYVGFSDVNKKAVTKKIMKYYRSASEEFTQSKKFVDQINNLIMEISSLMALPNSKDESVIAQIAVKINEFLGEFQRGSKQLTPKIHKLQRMLDASSSD